MSSEAWRCLNPDCEGGIFEPATGLKCPLCGVQMYKTVRGAPERRAPVFVRSPKKKRVVRRINNSVSSHPLMRKRYKHSKDNQQLARWLS